MDEILHHMRNPGMILYCPVNTDKQWLQSWPHFVMRNGFRNHPQYFQFVNYIAVSSRRSTLETLLSFPPMVFFLIIGMPQNNQGFSKLGFALPNETADFLKRSVE